MNAKDLENQVKMDAADDTPETVEKAETAETQEDAVEEA